MGGVCATAERHLPGNYYLFYYKTVLLRFCCGSLDEGHFHTDGQEVEHPYGDPRAHEARQSVSGESDTEEEANTSTTVTMFINRPTP